MQELINLIRTINFLLSISIQTSYSSSVIYTKSVIKDFFIGSYKLTVQVFIKGNLLYIIIYKQVLLTRLVSYIIYNVKLIGLFKKIHSLIVIRL